MPSKRRKKDKKEVTIKEWKVPSFSSDQVYTVRNEGSRWICTCPSYLKRRRQCKHIVHIRQRLGLVREDLSPWKSAIQKSIRRGDLALLKLSFGKLWEIDPKWLLWRFPILCGEESEMFVGIGGRVSFTENPSREEIWKVLANMTIQAKSKEAEGLRVFSRQIIEQKWNPEDFVEGERLRELLAWMDVQKRIDWDGTNKQEFWSWFNAGENPYVKETLTTCKRRFYTGGMGGDRELMVTIAWMCVTRPWQEPEMIEVPKEENVEPAKGLPWYVWDMHTSIGKIVRLELRKLIEDRMEWRYVTDDLWFNQESAKCDRLAEGSFWWPLMVNALWKRYGRMPEEAERDWQVWRPRIKALVEKEMVNQHG
jgi:hypothetical protein